MELITVSEIEKENFDNICNDLAKRGYKFVSSMQTQVTGDETINYIQQWAKLTE